MKKIFILITAIICVTALLAGCGSRKVEKRTDITADTAAMMTESTENPETETATPQATEAAITNDKPVRLYLMDYPNNTAKLIRTLDEEWDSDYDLATFGVFASDEDEISFDSEITAHQEDWDAAETDEDYKIGYEISFTLNGDDIDILILSPRDVEESEYLFMGDADGGDVTGYMGVWIYDDYNQEGGWYSHVTPDEVNDDTLLTSIKLRPTPDSDDITNLKLKTFSYPVGLEFNEIKQYNTQYGYEVSINR